MLTYQNSWKVYVANAPGTVTEAFADSYNFLRACLLTYSWFFSSVPNNDTPVDEARIRSQLNSTTANFYPRHSGYESDGITVATDYAPILIDIEAWKVTSFQGMTTEQTFTSLEKAKAVIRIVREIFPNRRISWYDWAPVNAWTAVKNWHSVQGNPSAANYSTYKTTFNSWKKQCELILRGGSASAKNNQGIMALTDFLAPFVYLPNSTTYDGSTPWQNNADCVLWSSYFTEVARQAKRIYQKPLLPYIQPFKPETTTYLGDEFFKHMLDVAYATKGDTDGVLVYYPSSAGTSPFRDALRDWVAANLL